MQQRGSKCAIFTLESPFWRLVGGQNRIFGGPWAAQGRPKTPTSAKTPPQEVPKESQEGPKGSSERVLKQFPQFLKNLLKPCKVLQQSRFGASKIGAKAIKLGQNVAFYLNFY